MPISPFDLFLSPDLTQEDAQRYLESAGFRDPKAADEHLQTMADDPVIRQTLGRLASRLLEALLESPSPDAAVVGLSRYLAARTGRVMFLDYLREDPNALHVITYVLGSSPFLSEILIRNPEYFHWLVSQIDRSAPDLIDLNEDIESVLASAEGRVEALDALKRFKRRQTLRIATRDLLGRDTVEAATAQLSDMASVIVDRALDIVVAQLLEGEGWASAPGAFAVIGMGKLGGRELNYSSDIDLIYVYDLANADDSAGHDFFQRLGRKLTAALGEHTAESYLYRVDLRLRPMGRTGNIAYSLEQYQQYYTAWGETFERFALIRARPIAGDAGLGRRFVHMVQPFVYRKYLDHAALEEMHRYKARTDRALQAGLPTRLPRWEPEAELPTRQPRWEPHAVDTGRNVKIGRGGIREVEVFTQVLQLTYGGGRPDLRRENTLAALRALRDAEIISEAVRNDLAAAYSFLRAVEHRLQLVQEAQTHTLSESAVEMEISARRLGFSSAEDLNAQLVQHRDRVHEIYRDLFEPRKGAGNFAARQFYRLLSDDTPEPQALAHLDKFGLRDPASALAVIRALAGSAAGAQAPSAVRNVLANLLAVLMPRIAGCARSEQVLIRVEQLASQSGNAALLCRSLLEDEALRDIVVQVLDAGDLPAQRLIRYPELLDSLTRPALEAAALTARLGTALNAFEIVDRAERKERAASAGAPSRGWGPAPLIMDRVRRLKQLEESKLLFDWLAGGSLEGLQAKLTLLADACVERAARRHMREPSGSDAWAIVALGKLGGVELTVHSDLDLVAIYEGEPEDSATFERYQASVQSLQAFLEEPTGEGIAYKIDMRLRPEGSKGALATPFVMFRQYLETRAEIWERMAWTRCRVVAGFAPLGEAIQSAATGFVYGSWDPQIPGYVDYVRGRMERELARESEQRVDFKVGRGGLADIDFALQLIQIREGRERPEFRRRGTHALLSDLPPTAYLDTDEVEQLHEAYGFLRRLETFARMDADSNISWIDPHAETLNPLATRMGFSERRGERLLQRYVETTTRVRSIYKAVLGRLAH